MATTVESTNTGKQKVVVPQQPGIYSQDNPLYGILVGKQIREKLRGIRVRG